MGLQIAGQLDLCEPIYRSILETQPAHAGSHYCLGMLLVQRRRPAEGSPHLLAAVNARPHVAEYWLGYLEALLLLRDIPKALETLSIARRHGLAGNAADDLERRLAACVSPACTIPAAPEPAVASKRNGKGKKAVRRQEAAAMALVNQGLFREALPITRKMTERFPEYGMGWKMHGAMLWAIGNESEAIEAMQISVRLLPTDAEARKNLGSAVNKQQRLLDAEQHLHRALQIDPNYAPAHLILGHNYQLQGRYAEARRSLQLAIDLGGGDAKIGHESARSLLLYVLNNDPSVDADSLFAAHCEVGAHLERSERAPVPVGRPARTAGQPIAHDANPDR